MQTQVILASEENGEDGKSKEKPVTERGDGLDLLLETTLPQFTLWV